MGLAEGMSADHLTIYAPRDGWLVKLAEDWQFEGDVPWPMAGGHGRWSIFMWRKA